MPLNHYGGVTVFTYELTSPTAKHRVYQTGFGKRSPPLELKGLSQGSDNRSLDQYSRTCQEIGTLFKWDESVTNRSRSDLLRHISSPGTECFLALKATKTVGIAELLTVGLDTEIRLFGLRRAFTGRGFGGQLLDRILEQAWQAGNRLHSGSRTRRIHLQTTSDDHPAARQLYESRGFQLIQEATLTLRNTRGRRARALE